MSASVHVGLPPPWSRHPPEQTTQNKHTPREQTLPQRRHPLGADTLLGADTPQEQMPPMSRHPPMSRLPESRPPRSRHPPWKQTAPGADTPQEQTAPQSRQPPIWHTVNERPVRILLECILVTSWISSVHIFYMYVVQFVMTNDILKVTKIGWEFHCKSSAPPHSSLLFKIEIVITARKRSLGQGNIFTPVCHSVHRRGVHGCEGVCVVVGRHAWLWGGMHGWLGGHVWLQGGMCGCQGGMCGYQGVCMVARGHVWLRGGTCMVAGGMHGCWGACMVAWGVCMVAGDAWLPRGMRGCWGHVWLQRDGVHGCRGCAWLPQGCVVVGGVHRIRRDTVNERVVRILLECILVLNLFKFLN